MGFISYCLSLSLYIMSSCLMRSSVLCDLNTLDACWIAVDVWSNSSRCRQESVYLLQMWCLYTWSCLDNLIIVRFSINCSTVICSPTVIFMLSREKPLVKPMPPGSLSYHICFQSTFICIFTICIYIIKYQKYIYLIILSLSDLTFASGREGIDNPFIALVASSLFVCVGSWDLLRSLLLDWYLRSQKLREILTLLCCITLFLFKENQRKLKT